MPAMSSPARRPGRAISVLIAVAALFTAVTPWLGAVDARLDPLSAILPLSPALAIVAAGTDRLRSRASLAAAVALILAMSILLPEFGAPNAPLDGRNLVIVTHNVAVANVDPESTVRTLLASDADLLLLQETDGRMARFLPALRVRFPFGSACISRCSLAILSRWPTSRVRYRFRGADGRAYGPGLIETTVFKPGLPTFQVATVHLSRKLAPDAALAQQRSLIDAAARAGMAGLIIAGDFNATPWSMALRRLDRGLAPMHRATRALFSFPARVEGRAFPAPLVPIDHLFAGPGWTPVSVNLLARTGSDHYPARIELVWQPPPAVLPNRR